MNLTVLFFGIATDLVGAEKVIFPMEKQSTLKEFKTGLLKSYPNLKNIDQYAVAINEEYAEEHSIINPGDIVAIIPPVSGG